jgi:hypothetical protein
MPNAGGYEYAVDFSSQPPTTGIQSTTNIAITLQDLIPNSKYYVHVRTKCFVTDASPWRLDSFITKMACYAPIVQVNNLGTNSPSAFWDPVPTAVAYEYALTHTSTEPAFGNTIYTTFADLELPEDGNDYYLHVRSKCNSMFTFSQWSTVALRTGTTSINSVAAADIRIFPNPVQDRLTVKGAPLNTVYTIMDLAGQVLMRGVINSDRETIDASSLAAGTYFLNLNNEALIPLRFIKH